MHFFTTERSNTPSAPLYQEVTFKQDFLPPSHEGTKKIKNKNGLLCILVPWWQILLFVPEPKSSYSRDTETGTQCLIWPLLCGPVSPWWIFWFLPNQQRMNSLR
jgi:hypothetical protein